jgi:hypothetical protein
VTEARKTPYKCFAQGIEDGEVILPKINMSALAALTWLPEKQIPRSEDFDPEHLTLEDAVDRAEAEEPEHPGEMPWIKTQDGTILGFAEIAPLRSGLRAARAMRLSRP